MMIVLIVNSLFFYLFDFQINYLLVRENRQVYQH